MKHYILKDDQDEAVRDYMNKHLSFMVDKVTGKMMIVLHKGDETRTWTIDSDSDADKIEQEIAKYVKQYLDRLKGQKNGKDR